ncbi:MAG: pyroglutamyl-peptidase I [Meiothermus sp.]|uniref:pyroglutamyl-peptidase I family protein n=1 Tax=Meiothermus sp. TaxID=1955249 RepID=UPI0025E92C7E|nr:pyroglutamyl-peptidase I [Meiothermus sp.]MCS7058007.1 pyroglutamyl-peptidase I [Meiothermus sp.]MCS7195121.1 pyroglutamyl-peptidase I [Meiothermus sp.]MCX7740769.1 pyroglutamyl-peptidase I [Meiothermus sp.]MDW8091388.1 pyroglutamyl-peptidase I [Meiothermus sp.]MDW8482484.1 pyroglutamyl-peptidase I [Meiothermus sp.]
MKALVTGFEPFADYPHNPSRAVLDLLPERVGGLELVRATLPVDTEQVRTTLQELYQKHQPAAVLHLGLAAGRALVCLERLAVNLLDFEVPDNAGRLLHDTPILPGGPLALHTRLPIRAIQARWKEAGIPSVLSNSAGLYLCNQVMYLALSWLPQKVPVGFIHLPPDETLALAKPQAYVPLKTQAQAVALALEEAQRAVPPGP